MVNSATTSIELTVLNFEYSGTLSMKKSVNPMKFLPHESRMDRMVAMMRAHFIGLLFGMTKSASTNSIHTNAPR